jgi:glycosyltransferase involved in cell wall biosynthesis
MTADRTSPISIGLNLLFLGERSGGVGRYARELLPALLECEPRSRITVFAGPALPSSMRAETWASEVAWTTIPFASGGPASQLAQYAGLPVLAAGRRLAVLHSPANTGPGFAPGVASVITLHDLIWRRHPEDSMPNPRAQRSMARWIGLGVRYADRVICDAEAVAEEIVEDLGVPRTRIEVAPLGCRPPAVTPAPDAAVRSRLGLDSGARVVLCVAQKLRYKNIEALVRALPALDGDIVLVAPGTPTAHEQTLRELAERLGVTDRVRFPDWLSDSELAGLYALSTVFALPTLAEGFGLPVLEAMSQGLPVACSDIPVLREVAGEAAMYFSPLEQTSVDACLRRLLGDRSLRDDLARRGARRAAQFTWTATAEATLRGYRTAIAARRHGARR